MARDLIGHRIYSGDLHAWATVIGEVARVREQVPLPQLAAGMDSRGIRMQETRSICFTDGDWLF